MSVDAACREGEKVCHLGMIILHVAHSTSRLRLSFQWNTKEAKAVSCPLDEQEVLG